MNNISSSISIGICTSNDEKTIDRLLFNLTKKHKITNFTTKKQFRNNSINIREIIVVSSGCIDSTNSIVKSYIKEFPNLITLITEKYRTGKPNALNIIFRQFLGEYLVLIPADACTSMQSILLLVNRIKHNKNIGIAFGRAIIDHQSHHCTPICKMNTSLWNLHIQAMSLKGNIHASGELMALQRESATKIPTNVINDDAYLSQMIFERKKKIDFVSSSIVLITSPVTFKDYINQRKRIYLGHKQLKFMGFEQTIPFNRLVAHNKIFYLKLFIQEIKTMKKLSYLSLALIVEFYLKLRIKFNVNQQFTDLNIWKRITVDFSPSMEMINNLD